MKIKIFGGILVAALAITSVAEAQTHTPVINARQHREQARINQGVRSGELAPGETRWLRNAERKLRYDKRMAMADGRITRAERRHLRREENQISRETYRLKHNGRVRE